MKCPIPEFRYWIGWMVVNEREIVVHASNAAVTTR